MPFLAPVIAAAAVFIAANSAWLVPLISTVVSVGLGFLSKALQKKPKAPEFSAPAVNQDRTQMIKTSRANRRIVIGEVKLGGILSYHESEEGDNDHRMIVTLCDGPIDGIPVVWFNDQPIYEDQISGGEVISGPFSGKAAITKYLGTADQAENTNMPDGSRGLGIAYLDILIRWDVDTYPLGLPDVSAEVRGLKFIDRRDVASPTVEKFTANPFVALRSVFISNEWWGLEYDEGAVPDDYFNPAANTCDEIVQSSAVNHTVKAVSTSTGIYQLSGGKLQFFTGDRVEVLSDESPGVPVGTPSPAYVIVVRNRNRGPAPEWKVGIDEDTTERVQVRLANSYENAIAGVYVTPSTTGAGTLTMTKTGEPRYTVNALIEAPIDDFSLADNLVRAAAGRASNVGGEWYVVAGAYVTPEIEFTEADIIAPIRMQTRIPWSSRFNAIHGAYYSPLNDWQPSDYPSVRNEAYEVEDGDTRYSPLDLEYTNRPGMAQRIAKIELERNRGNEISLDIVTTLKGLRVKAGDTILLTNSYLGFDEKPFEVVGLSLTVEEDQDNRPTLAVAMSLRETQPAVFSFSSVDDETIVAPIVRTNLANPWFVPAPTGLYARTVTILTDQGDTVFSAALAWTIAAAGTVDNRGHFEIQTRRSNGLGLLFNGISQYVSFASNIDFSGDVPAAFCIQVAAKWNGAEGSPVGDQGIYTNGQFWLYRRQSDGKIVGGISLDGSPVSATVASTSAIPSDSYTKIALAWTGTVLKLYIDGALDNSVAAVGTLSPTAIAPVYGRGKEQNSSGFHWSGALDDLRIWRHTALSDAEIASSTDMVLEGNEDNLYGYWPSDDRLIGIIADTTINGNFGTINNGATYTDGAVAPNWDPSWSVAGSQRFTGLPSLEAAINYDIRIRSVNSLGVRSAWSQIFDFTVGSVGGAAEQMDLGLVSEAAESPQTDYGSVEDAVTETLDLGTVT